MKKTLLMTLVLMLALSLCMGAFAYEEQTSQLLLTLPDYICTPDSMAQDAEGNLILTCPNFAALCTDLYDGKEMPSCVVKIDKDLNVTKWFDVPVNERSGVACAMGLDFGPDGELYLVDNQGWTGLEQCVNQGRVLKITFTAEGEIDTVTEMAIGMEHPNGVRYKDGFVYVTQSSLSPIKTYDGKLVSGVYKFPADAEGIEITNSMDDANLLVTYVTQNPNCQYGLDGIVFDAEGHLYVGNYGDGTVHRITFAEDGSIAENVSWAANRQELNSTDGMNFDENGNLYVADFNGNAIVCIDPAGNVFKVASSPDSDGQNGELDQPGEPFIWNGKLIASCFDCVVDDQKVNQSLDNLPATMAVMDLVG